jgi:hypothetical protein
MEHLIVNFVRLAQLVERKTFNLVVVGSSPTADTKSDCLKQLNARVPESGQRGTT